MRPRHVRTSLFHELLISYLASCKRRGFHYAHIWACPTTRGGDFIYWCHPTFQKNPDKDRLLQWYLGMTKKAQQARVVYGCNDLYSTHFQHLEDRLDQVLPPYFDGDYWPAEVERLAAAPPKRGKMTKEAYEESLRGEKFRKRVVDSVNVSKDSLFVIALHPECSTCRSLVVNAVYWEVSASDPESSACYFCASCRSTAPADAQQVCPPEFVTAKHQLDDEDSTAEVSCAFLNHRPDMLKNCEEHHYQFDSFRRAKYSTMMLIYQIHSTQTMSSRL